MPLLAECVQVISKSLTGWGPLFRIVKFAIMMVSKASLRHVKSSFRSAKVVLFGMIDWALESDLTVESVAVLPGCNERKSCPTVASPMTTRKRTMHPLIPLAGLRFPQCGHDALSVLICLPHSLQGTSPMARNSEAEYHESRVYARLRLARFFRTQGLGEHWGSPEFQTGFRDKGFGGVDEIRPRHRTAYAAYFAFSNAAGCGRRFFRCNTA